MAVQFSGISCARSYLAGGGDHTQKYSGILPGSELGDYSGQCSADQMGCQGSNLVQIGHMQGKCPSCCTISSPVCWKPQLFFWFLCLTRWHSRDTPGSAIRNCFWQTWGATGDAGIQTIISPELAVYKANAQLLCYLFSLGVHF